MTTTSNLSSTVFTVSCEACGWSLRVGWLSEAHWYERHHRVACRG